MVCSGFTSKSVNEETRGVAHVAPHVPMWHHTGLCLCGKGYCVAKLCLEPGDSPFPVIPGGDGVSTNKSPGGDGLRKQKPGNP